MPHLKLGNYFNCVNCSKLIYRSLGDQRKAPKKRFKCSKQCYSPTISEKKRARMKLGHYVHVGTIKKPKDCQRCGNETYLEGHHHDYSKPLDVEWLCKPCHDIEHKEIRQQIVESRRKHFEPCKCGKKAICKNRCATCYSHFRASQIKTPCQVPKCKRKSHTRGLCDRHKQRKAFYIYALPRQKPGTKPSKH